MLWDATGQVNIYLQSTLGDPRWLLPVTHLGDRIYMLLLIPLVYFLISRRDAIVLLAGTALTFYVNSLLKLFFHQPRPFWVSPLEIHAFEGSFGFPSGHAQNSLVVWALFALILVRNGIMKRWLAFSLFGLLIFLISVSRIVLGAHFIQDTLFGWFVGSVLLALLVWLEHPVEERLAALDFKVRLVLLLILAAILPVIAMLAIPEHLPDLASWNAMARQNAENTGVSFHDLHPTGLKSFLTVAGLLGGVALAQYLPADPLPDSRSRRMGIFLLTLVALVVLYFVTGLIAPGGWMAEAWHACRYFLFTITALLLVPLLALRSQRL